MRFQAAVFGNLREYMASEVAGAETGVTLGVGAAGEGLKTELRAQITASGLGERLAKTWRSRVYPVGEKSASAAALIWTKAPELVDAFDRGVTIRSKDGFYLAIPTAAAGTQRGSRRQGRLTPGIWERRTGRRLRFVYRRGAPSLLVADGVRVDKRGFAVSNEGRRNGRTYTRLQGATTSVIFVLLPQVTLRKRLNVQESGSRWQARLPTLVLEYWPK